MLHGYFDRLKAENSECYTFMTKIVLAFFTVHKYRNMIHYGQTSKSL